MAVVANAINTAGIEDRDRIWDSMAAWYQWPDYDSMSVGEKLAACEAQIMADLNDLVGRVEHRDEAAALPPPDDVQFQ